MDSSKVIYDLFDEMFQSKYKDIQWYCHNFGEFDSIFVISALQKYNKYTDNKNKYEMEFIYRRGSIIMLTVKNLIEKSRSKVEIRDSYAILPDKLKKLCKEFDVDKEKEKDDFPHDFANENTLFYIGNTPDIKYYAYDIDIDTYISKYKTN